MNRSSVSEAGNEKESSINTDGNYQEVLPLQLPEPAPPPHTQTSPPQDETHLNQEPQEVGPIAKEEKSLIETIQGFQVVTKISKFDALLQVRALDEKPVITTPTRITDCVRYLTFYNQKIDGEHTPVAIGNNRCQLICQMHLTSYQQAKQLPQQKDDDALDSEGKGVKDAAAAAIPTGNPSAATSATTNVTAPTPETKVLPESSDTTPSSDTAVPPNTAVNSPSNPKVQSLLEQIYEIIFHQHRIDDDCQRSGTFVVVVPPPPPQQEQPNRYHPDEAMTLIELPKSWALEFIRHQLDGNENVDTSSVVVQITSSGATTTTSVPSRSAIVDSTGTVGGAPDTATSVTTTETTNAFLMDEETIKRRRRSSLLRRSVSSGDVFADHKKRMATYRGSIVLSQQIHRNTLDDDISSDSEEEDREHSLSNESLKSASEVKSDRKHESTTSSSQLDDGADWVPTLARYTSAQSIVSQSSLLSWNRPTKKPNSPFRIQPRPILERTPSWSEGITDIQTNHEGNIIVHTANALDVIFMKKSSDPHPSDATSSETYQLIPTQHTGNSRIMVMVQLDLPKYLEYLKTEEEAQHATAGQKSMTGSSVSTSHSQIRQLCRDLVNAVQTNYDGRFLMEQNDTIGADIFDDNNNDYYVLLSDEQAVSAVECIFQVEKRSREPLESSEDEARINSNAVQKPAASSDKDKKPNSTAGTTKSRTPSVIKKEAMEQLYRLSTTIQEALTPNCDESVDGNLSTTTASTRKSTTNNSTVTAQTSNTSRGKQEEMSIQTNAIKSLQQRKKRQGLSSKISQMGTINNPSAAAILEIGIDDRSQSVGTLMQPQRQSFSSSLLLRNPLNSNEHMLRSHSTGHDERLYSSLPVGLNYEYEGATNLYGYVDDRELMANPSHLTNNTYPSTINEQIKLHPNNDGSNRMPVHQPLPVLQNHIYPSSQSQMPQEMEDHQYYQIQQEQIYQQQQLFSAPRLEHVPHPNRRQSALSKFSQDMIQEMLLRAHGARAPGTNHNINITNTHQAGHNYDPSPDLNFLGDSFGSLDDLTNDGSPTAFNPAHQHQQRLNQDHQPVAATNPPNYSVNNNNNSAEIPVAADAAAAAYLLGFGRFEV